MGIFFFILFLTYVSAVKANFGCDPFFKFNFSSGKCEKIILPENAVFNKDNTDWDCLIGYKKDYLKNLCQKVIIPQNGKLNSTGDGFTCDRGYKKTTDFCQKIELPENAVLDFSGNDFNCIASYKKNPAKNTCEKVNLPDNARFFNSGFDFFCNSQFKVSNGQCEKFRIPANAHLEFLGNDWQCDKGFFKNPDLQRCDPIFTPLNSVSNSLGSFDCDPGYEKSGNECKRTEKVLNGKFYESGTSFYCLPGFIKNDQLRSCEKIQIPDNAKADRSSLDGWICLGGYIKTADKKCIKFDLPQNALWIGNFWDCKAGFMKNSDASSCDKVSIPDNAYPDLTNDRWSCNTGYSKNYSQNKCDKVN